MKQLKNMFAEKRLIATIIVIVSFILTLVAAIVVNISFSLIEITIEYRDFMERFNLIWSDKDESIAWKC